MGQAEDSILQVCQLTGLTLATYSKRWTASRGDSRTTHATILSDSVSLLQKVKSGMVIKAYARMRQWSTFTFQNSCGYTGHAGVKGNDRGDRLAGKVTLTRGLRLGRSEVLRSLRYYLLAKRHRQSDEHWNCFKVNVGESSESQGGAHMGSSEHIDSILN